jgi:outer membrane protein
MKKLCALLVGAATLLAPVAAIAAEGPLLVRVRGVYVVPADKSDAIPALSVGADKISVSKKLIPEVDFSYFILVPNLAIELILTYPQEHDVSVDGVGKIGTVTHLPPVLAAQWHFLPDFVVNPYVGVGVNLTLITSQSLSVPLTPPLPLEISGSSVGFAAQVGADFKVADRIYVNADVKYVTMGFDVKTKADGAKVSAVTLNPWLFAVGVGYRFF